MPFGERLSLVSSSPIFQALDSSILSEIARRAVCRTHPPGEFLYRKGEEADSVLLVINGLVRLSLASPEGREFSVRLATRGDSLGETALANAISRDTDCLALTHSRVLKIRRNMLSKADIGAISSDLNRLLGQRLSSLLAIVEEIALHNLEGRLARLFCRLDQQQYLSLHQLHQGLLANMANASRPKVNQQLKKLHNLGAIKLASGQVISINRALLTKLFTIKGEKVSRHNETGR
ncbi:Crp/Fnr family transcriptional regulator [Microbulbifer halophilus]|uniref:Crp/Fnr family transcriptional regulator n=1 Tax=Microbulbifer halophilus TaxID=453963 RepID=UPI0036075E87